jgi:hypothetical protein
LAEINFDAMMILTAGLALLWYFALAGVVAVHFFKRPFGIIAITGVLTIVWYFVPAWAVAAGRSELFDYSNSQLFNAVGPPGQQSALNLILLSLGLATALVMGACLGTYDEAVGSALPTYRRPVRGTWILAGCVFVWALIAMFLVRTSGFSVLELFAPSRKDRSMYLSEYVRLAFVFIPMGGMVTSYLLNRRMRWHTFLFVGIAIASALGTGQRRHLFTVFLLLLGCILFAGSQGGRDSIRQGRRAVVAVGLALTVFIPVSWWLRSWFSSVVFAETPVARLPWEARGFLELLFGSPGSGFPTFVGVADVVHSSGTQWGENLLFLLSVAIPRRFWPGKPTAPDAILVNDLGLTASPSIFWIGDLYLFFGPLSPLVAFVGGYIVARGMDLLVGSPSIHLRVIAAVLLAQTVTFFKNGFTAYATAVGFELVLVLGPVLLAFPLSLHRTTLAASPTAVEGG